MANVLLLFVHPLLEKSRVHGQLLQAARSVAGVTVHDLYEQYPDFDVDVRREQELLLRHDIIVWQHPFYWYSAPPLLKQWQDLVLEHGWAYGKRGTALEGKKVLQVLSSGGSRDAYRPGGFNKYGLREYLRPFERTAELCRMEYWPPYWIDGVHRMDASTIQQHARQFRSLLVALKSDLFSEEEFAAPTLMNELFPINQINS